MVTEHTKTSPASTAIKVSDKMDVVYVVRPGDDNEELRYSLRSLANLPHRTVIIAGYRPNWVNPDTTIWVERDQTDQPDLTNTNENLIAVMSHLDELSDDFILFNDDFYVMEPVTAIPYQHQGSLDERIEGYKKTVMLQAYSLIKTKKELVRLGAPLPYHSYELHTPFIYNKHKLQSLYRLTDEPMFALRPRTLYGNYYQLNGAYTHDVKHTEPILGPFFSTADSGLEQPRRPELRPRSAKPGPRDTASYVRGSFPTASPYEIVPASVQSQERADYDNN